MSFIRQTLIELGVGAGAGAADFAAPREDDTFSGFNQITVGVFTVIGAGAGAITGYLLGRRSRKQVLLYQAK